MNSVKEMTSNWDQMAKEDPLWLICTDPDKKNNKWNIREFFSTGRYEISVVLDYLFSIEVTPKFNGHSLDFGCGVGRLSQALAEKFDRVTGIDISKEMISRANEFNKFPDKCRYIVNDAIDLSLFEDSTFDFIYSSIVLQHVPRDLISGYLNEFGRVIKPGGIILFQLPDRFKSVSLIARIQEELQLRIRLKKLLRFVTGKPGLNYIEVNRFSEQSVCKIFKFPKFEIRDIQLTNSLKSDFNGRLKYLDQEPEFGLISKQYCVIKK